MAELLKERLEVEVELVTGKAGELSVWHGDRLLARRNWLAFLPVEGALASAAARALEAQK